VMARVVEGKSVPLTLPWKVLKNDYPVIRSQITVGSRAEGGAYSIRLQSVSGELSYLAGAITIKP